MSANLFALNRRDYLVALGAFSAVAVKDAGCETDDLFMLLDPLDRKENWSDTFHHKGPVRERTARQVAKSVCPEFEDRK